MDHCFRGVIFVAGLLVVISGAALWLFTMLLTAPLIFAGLWIWSWEFLWASRLLHTFRIWWGRFWDRVRRRPLRWAVLTTLGVLSGAALYYASYAFGPL